MIVSLETIRPDKGPSGIRDVLDAAGDRSLDPTVGHVH
jgi:hypothetical protein